MHVVLLVLGMLNVCSTLICWLPVQMSSVLRAVIIETLIVIPDGSNIQRERSAGLPATVCRAELHQSQCHPVQNLCSWKWIHCYWKAIPQELLCKRYVLHIWKQHILFSGWIPFICASNVSACNLVAYPNTQLLPIIFFMVTNQLILLHRIFPQSVTIIQLVEQFPAFTAGGRIACLV